MIDVNTLFLLAGGIFITGLLGELLFTRTGIPDVIILLVIGILVGPVFGLFDPGTLMSVAPYVASIALVLILFDSGLAMNVTKLIRQSPRALLLTVLNFAFSLVFTAVGMHLALGWDYTSGALLGAIIGGTSSVTVISFLKRVKPSEEVANDLILESVLTDALTVVFAVTLSQVIASGGQLRVDAFSMSLLGAFSVGTLIGMVSGIAWLYVASRKKVKSPKPMLAVASIAILYAITEMLGGNGAISILFFGIILGNGAELAAALRIAPLRVDLSAIRVFQTEISFFVRTFFFVYLGAMFVAQDVTLIIIGALLSLGFMALRKLAALVSSIGSRTLSKEQWVLSAIAPRGLASAVTVQLPFYYGLYLAHDYLEIVLSVIIATTLFSSFLISIEAHRNAKNCGKPHAKKPVLASQ